MMDNTHEKDLISLLEALKNTTELQLLYKQSYINCKCQVEGGHIGEKEGREFEEELIGSINTEALCAVIMVEVGWREITFHSTYRIY